MAKDKAKLSSKKPKISKSKLKDTKLIIGLCAGLALIAFFAVLMLLRQVVQTETYYVLNEDVGPRTQLQAEQLTPIVTREGTAPPNALNIADVQTGSMFTQYPLRAGDIITQSTVGALNDISVGIPENWVVTSFGVPSDYAVGGRIQRGTYFDIIGIDNESNAFYIFSNVLALDTTVSTDSLSSADAIDSEEARAGQTEQYYIGLSPQNAMLLHSALREYDVRLVLSPRENDYVDEIDTSDLDGYFFFDPNNRDEVPEVGSMTDPTFTPVERDEDGRPIAWGEDGNQMEVDDFNDDTDITGSDTPSQSQNTPSENFDEELDNNSADTDSNSPVVDSEG